MQWLKVSRRGIQMMNREQMRAVYFGVQFGVLAVRPTSLQQGRTSTISVTRHNNLPGHNVGDRDSLKNAATDSTVCTASTLSRVSINRYCMYVCMILQILPRPAEQGTSISSLSQFLRLAANLKLNTLLQSLKVSSSSTMKAIKSVWDDSRYKY